MKERPILFNGEMVRAVLGGWKTNTRRVIKPQPWSVMPPRHMEPVWPYGFKYYEGSDSQGEPFAMKSPYGQPGDQLWVRETCRAEEFPCGDDVVRYPADNGYIAIENTSDAADKWVDLNHYGFKKNNTRGNNVPSIHAPRWTSRIDLKVTGVHVERVQDITTDAIKAEGVQIPVSPEGKPLLRVTGPFPPCDYLDDDTSGDSWLLAHWISLWESINKKRGFAWDTNPWVWVVEFKRIA